MGERARSNLLRVQSVAAAQRGGANGGSTRGGQGAWDQHHLVRATERLGHLWKMRSTSFKLRSFAPLRLAMRIASVPVSWQRPTSLQTRLNCCRWSSPALVFCPIAVARDQPKKRRRSLRTCGLQTHRDGHGGECAAGVRHVVPRHAIRPARACADARMRRRTHAQTHACGAGVRMAQPCTTAARDHVRSCGAHVKHDASSLKKRFGSPPTSFT